MSLSNGTGKLKPAGGVAGAMKESIQRAFTYLLSNKNALGVGREVDTSDFHVEVIGDQLQPDGEALRPLRRGLARPVGEDRSGCAKSGSPEDGREDLIREPSLVTLGEDEGLR